MPMDARPRVTAADGAVAEYERDDAGRLVAARNAEVELGWSYDESGRLIEERQGDAVVRHLYDDTGHAGIRTVARCAGDATPTGGSRS